MSKLIIKRRDKSVKEYEGTPYEICDALHEEGFNISMVVKTDDVIRFEWL